MYPYFLYQQNAQHLGRLFSLTDTGPFCPYLQAYDNFLDGLVSQKYDHLVSRMLQRQHINNVLFVQCCVVHIYLYTLLYLIFKKYE